MKKFLAIAIICLAALTSACAQNNSGKSMNGDFAYPVKLISDKTTNGVREIIVKTNAQVCSKQIDVKIKNGVIQKVEFTGGCPGNTQGVERLVAGMKVKDAVDKLGGIDCAGRGTSCPDQLAQALIMAL